MSQIPRIGIFVCYSHKDHCWLERLHLQLKPLIGNTELFLWDDTKLKAGQRWHDEIEQALLRAKVAVLLVSPYFLDSEYIREVELPAILKATECGRTKLYWVLVTPCAYDVTSLSRYQAASDVARPLESLLATAHELNSVLLGICRKIARDAGVGPSTPRWVATDASAASGEGLHPRCKVSIGSLPMTGADLYGRDEELRMLDEAWNEPYIDVLSIVAMGGIGKTALVKHWLREMRKKDYCGAEGVFAWTFYNQSASEPWARHDLQAAASDQFFDKALAFFDDPQPTAGSPWERGERLARLLQDRRALLILDGSELLLHRQQRIDEKELTIQDEAMRALLGELQGRNLGLCIVTARHRIKGLFEQRELNGLSPPGGAQLLRRLGVHGADAELMAASDEFQGHPLALNLLGTFLHERYDGDIGMRQELSLLCRHVGHEPEARHVMESYVTWYGPDSPEVGVLKLVSLFDHPVDADSIETLRRRPVIEGLNEALIDLKHHELRTVVSKLQRAQLLRKPQPADEPRAYTADTLDAHPLVRAYFAERLRKNSLHAWRQGHDRLYEHLIQVPRDEKPKTVQEMLPLLEALSHGCEAERHRDAFENVYWRRIAQQQFYFHNRPLDRAFSTVLHRLTGFFYPLQMPLGTSHADMSRWTRPIRSLAPEQHLTREQEALLQEEAGHYLFLLGRLDEAIPPLKAAVQARKSLGQWRSASKHARILRELFLAKGELRQALRSAEESVNCNDQWQLQPDGDVLDRGAALAGLAQVKHYLGQDGAQADFEEAERILNTQTAEVPLLYVFQSSWYCEFLIDRTTAKGTPETVPSLEHVKERARRMIAVATGNKWVIDEGLGYMTLGLATLAQGKWHGAPAVIQEANDHLDHAVDCLQQSGHRHHLVRGHLARASARRELGKLLEAEFDLGQVEQIAQQGTMHLHQAEYHIERGWLCLARFDRDADSDLLSRAQDSLCAAEVLVQRLHYNRRQRDVTNLKQALVASSERVSVTFTVKSQSDGFDDDAWMAALAQLADDDVSSCKLFRSSADQSQLILEGPADLIGLIVKQLEFERDAASLFVEKTRTVEAAIKLNGKSLVLKAPNLHRGHPTAGDASRRRTQP